MKWWTAQIKRDGKLSQKSVDVLKAKIGDFLKANKDAKIAERWFAWPNIFALSPVPILVALAASGLYWSIRRERDLWPFLLSLSLFMLSYAGLGISLYPYVVPRSVTIWDAAAPDESLSFLLVGAGVLLPIILGHTAYAYWVFRGKTDQHEGYH